jgi:hypothetical protein
MKIKNSISPRYSLSTSNRAGYFYHSYYGGIDKIFHTKDELEDYKTKINTILDNKGDGKIGKTIYVGKGSNVPRHKIKAFTEENKIKKTTIMSNAETIIFDRKAIKDTYDWLKGCKEAKVAIVPFTKNLYDIVIKANSLTNTSYAKIYTECFNKKANLIIHYEEYNNYPLDFKQELGILDWKDYYEQNTYRTRNTEEVFDTILCYLKNPHGNIIWDDIILEKLNSEGIDLDDDYVDTLDSMFSSKEPDNIRLAVEMMSNVNLEKFGLTIALLLNKHSSNMNWGNGNTGSQAYKTLDRYFLNKGIDWKRDYRSFSAGLYKNYANDKGAKETIEQFVLQNINRHLAENGFGYQGCMLQIDNFKISLHNRK